MDDPPHQLDLLQALRLLEESCGGDEVSSYTTALDDMEFELSAQTARIVKRHQADAAAERLRTRARLA